MKNKKVILILSLSILVVLIGLITYFVLNKQDKTTTLTIFDKQWIESHKNNLIDMEIETDIPIFNYNGTGVFFDFLTSFEKNVGIEFNRVAKRNNGKQSYSFSIVDKAADKDIIIYKDNYVLVSKNDIKYSNVNKIQNMTIGVLETNMENANKYLKGSSNITFRPYANMEDLINSLEIESGVNAIMVLKTLNMDDILAKNLFINYNLSDFTNDYVITLGDDDKLNSIIKKYYNKWYSESYDKSYQTNFSDHYFLFNNIAEKERVDFRSKRYIYGFVENPPYDHIVDGSLIGINASIMSDFSKIADIEIVFNEYKDNEELIKKFNSNKIDFFFNYTNNEEYDMDIINTVSTNSEKIVYVSHLDNNIVVHSVNSLKDLEIKVIKGSKISSYLQENNISVKEYNNIESLMNSVNSKSVLAIDRQTYNYYSRSLLSKFKIDFEDEINKDYFYTIRNISDNKIFSDFFDFYLSFNDEKYNTNKSYTKLLNTKSRNNIIFNIVVYLLAILGALSFVIKMFKLLLTKRKKKDALSKEHKLKYVDMLTSLKNRNYLNDNIEKWDNSEVYPQTIIVIDLNNVAYINDNYGHQEGDSLIKEAANILIKTQVSNTEIIRTNGNEFLIYMVGYDEKQVIAYIRKLNKEFKELAHGFGAAIGYSIINDAIKTIDDAVNEATIDMRNNKEEIQN